MFAVSERVYNQKILKVPPDQVAFGFRIPCNIDELTNPRTLSNRIKRFRETESNS